MASDELLKFRGRLEEKRLQAESIRIRMEGLRNAIREALDPFEDLEHLKCEHAAALAVELANLQIEYKQLNAEMDAIRRALGR